MHVEAGNGIEHPGIGDVDGNIGREFSENITETADPVFEQQDCLGRNTPARPMRGGKHAQHDGALGDEPAVPPGKILFLDRYKAGDARISRIVDTDGVVRHEPVRSVRLDGHIRDDAAGRDIENERLAVATADRAVEQDLAARQGNIRNLKSGRKGCNRSLRRIARN